MTRIFIEVPLFTKRWREVELDDNDLIQLQQILLENPQSGVMMQGPGGIRIKTETARRYKK